MYPGIASASKTNREYGRMKMKLRTQRTKEKVIIERDGETATFYGFPLTPKETTQFLQESVEVSWDRNQRFESPDIYKFKIKKLQRVIEDWEGVEDANGLPMKCTKANVEIVYLFNAELMDEVLEKFDEIGSKVEQNLEHLEKNSLAGPDGPATLTK